MTHTAHQPPAAHREMTLPASPTTIGAVVADGKGRREAYVPPGAASRRPPEPHPRLPKGWPRVAAEKVWRWRAQHPGPVIVLVAGAEGGVGTSLLTALLVEALAASSPWPTLALEQSGTPLGTMSRYLVGQPAGTAAPVFAHHAHARGGVHAVIDAVSTSAGALVVDDRCGYTPTSVVTDLVRAGGACVVDAGRVELSLLARAAEVGIAIVVVVGRADLRGAEAVCAQLALLRRGRHPVQPLVVLSSCRPIRRRQVAAAATLVRTAGITEPVHLPHDRGLTACTALRLDRIRTATAAAVLDLITRIAHRQEARHAR